MSEPTHRPVTQLLSVSELANHLGVPESTVYRWNYRGDGPAYLKVGKYVRYRAQDVEAWLAARAQHGAA